MLDWDTVEFALRTARQGDAPAEQMARETFRLQRQLLDPVWGGVYQYSVGGGWNEPHFEKLVQMQAENLRVYGLAQWARITGDTAAIAEAERAARWIIAHRALPGGGFRHDGHDAAGPFLGDTLAMGRTFLALHQLTQQPEWLRHAMAAADYIASNFGRDALPGFTSSRTGADALPAPPPSLTKT